MTNHPSPRRERKKLSHVIARLIVSANATRMRAAINVALALLIAFVAFSYGSKIHIGTDIKRLLPAEAPSVRALDELRTRMGSDEEFTLAIESKDPKRRAAIVHSMAQTIESWPETLSLSTGRDFTPFRDHLLYYLDESALDSLLESFINERRKSVARSLASTVGSGEEIDLSKVLVGEDDWDDWDDEEADDESPSEDARKGDPPSGSSLLGWLEQNRQDFASRSPLSERELDLVWPRVDDENWQWEDRVEDLYVDEDDTVQLIKAKLTGAPTDVVFATDLAKRISEQVERLEREGTLGDARVQIVAAYNVSKDIDTILRDAKRATYISIALVFAVLVIGFRSVRSLLLILFPMAIATAITLAAARFLLGELNALTVFLFAVLFGMGVDFAIHLYAHRKQGHAWIDVLQRHLPALAASMATTCGSFAVLSIAEFKAFREFGVICSVGVAICFACALYLVPTLDRLIHSDRAMKETLDAAPSHSPPSVTAGRKFPRLARNLFILVTVGLGFVGIPKVSFEKDLRQLNAQPKGSQRIRYWKASGPCTKTIALIADDPSELDITVDGLSRDKADQTLLPGRPDLPGRTPNPWVKQVFSVHSTLPKKQEEKQRRLTAIATEARAFLDQLPELDEEAKRQRSKLEALERLARADVLRADELPQWAMQPFRELDGNYDRIAHLCVDIRKQHIDELVAMNQRIKELSGEGVLRADSRLVFADLVNALEVDSRRLPLASLTIILFFIAFDLGRIGPTLACFGALALGLALTVATMGLWPLRLNFFNLVVMPAVLGLSIDAAIHLWHARGTPAMMTTAKAAWISALTTIGGFTGLLFAEHPGLRSIGELGVMAVGVCVVVIFVVLYRR